MTDRIQKKPAIKNNQEKNEGSEHFLMLFNDSVHSFDYVIETLIEVCGHSSVQAEQCAFITHYKGLCEVKQGDRESLEPMEINLIKKGLKAKIQ